MHDKAEADYKKVVQLSPTDSVAYLKRGDKYITCRKLLTWIVSGKCPR